ncbi:MAG: hypothetical protein ACT4QC_22300 [Planctomycetaceae bacterium]
MNSIPVAMTWEFWRKHRWNLLLVWAGMACLPTLIFAGIRYQGATELRGEGFYTFHVTWLIVQAFGFACATLVPQGDPLSRLYPWPISTATIVHWKLAPAMAAAALLYLLNTLYLNTLFDVGWPLLAPALFLACICPALHAAIWLGEKAPLLQLLAMTAIAVPVGFWLQTRYGPLFKQPTHLWTELTGNDLIVLVGIALLGYAGCLIGIARDRCGETLWWLGLSQWFERALSRSGDTARPFPSRLRAQFWYEWQQKGLLLPAISLFVIAIIVVFASVRRTPIQDLKEFLEIV